MPFKSKAQARFMFAAEARGEVKPGTAREWAHETPDIKALPEHVDDNGEKKKAQMEKTSDALRRALQQGTVAPSMENAQRLITTAESPRFGKPTVSKVHALLLHPATKGHAGGPPPLSAQEALHKMRGEHLGLPTPMPTQKEAMGLSPPPPLPTQHRRKKTPKLPDSILQPAKMAGCNAALEFYGVKEADALRRAVRAGRVQPSMANAQHLNHHMSDIGLDGGFAPEIHGVLQSMKEPRAPLPRPGQIPLGDEISAYDTTVGANTRLLRHGYPSFAGAPQWHPEPKTWRQQNQDELGLALRRNRDRRLNSRLEFLAGERGIVARPKTAAFSPAFIHGIAKRQDIDVNDPEFKEKCRGLTGRAHLDDMNSGELGQVAKMLWDKTAASKTANTRTMQRMWDAVQRMPAGQVHPSKQVQNIRDRFDETAEAVGPANMSNAISDTVAGRMGSVFSKTKAEKLISGGKPRKISPYHLLAGVHGDIAQPDPDWINRHARGSVDPVRIQRDAMSGRHEGYRTPIEPGRLPYNPEQHAYRFGNLPTPGMGAEKHPAWLTGHPEVAHAQTERAYDPRHMRSYDPKKLPEHAGWTPEVSISTLGMTPEKARALANPRHSRHRTDHQYADSPYYERVNQFQDLKDPTATFKRLPGDSSSAYQQVQGTPVGLRAEARTPPIEKVSPRYRTAASGSARQMKDQQLQKQFPLQAEGPTTAPPLPVLRDMRAQMAARKTRIEELRARGLLKRRPK